MIGGKPDQIRLEDYLVYPKTFAKLKYVRKNKILPATVTQNQVDMDDNRDIFPSHKHNGRLRLKGLTASLTFAFPNTIHT